VVKYENIKKNMKEKIVNLTKQLVRFRSHEDSLLEKRKIFNFVDDWFLGREIKTEKFDHPKHPSLLVNIPGVKAKTVLLMAHLDVVSASDEMFEVKLENDIMRGRGVLDNKGVVAMLMLLIEKLKESSEDLPSVKILFTTDEEIGGENGAGRVAGYDHFQDVDFIIAPDGGLQNKIIHKEKGILQLSFEVKGKSGHGAKPWLSDNPIEKAYELYQKISRFLSDLESDSEWYSTVSLTKLIAGKEINRIPESAEMSIDIRCTEKHIPEELLEKIRLFFDDSVKVKNINISQFLYSPSDHDYIKKYHQVMEEESGEKVSIEGEHSGSDASHFMPLQVPIILHRANGGDVHSENEWASISSFEKMMLGLEKFLKDFN